MDCTDKYKMKKSIVNFNLSPMCMPTELFKEQGHGQKIEKSA